MDADALDAAYSLLFLKAAEPPAGATKHAKRAARELRMINDWNGAQRVAGGTSGEVLTSSAGAWTYGRRRGCGGPLHPPAEAACTEAPRSGCAKAR